mmetsp:Transcript_12857/g.35596  ORF Transcript_12857/g.35596 Transcript_12857/m.35596 type:complete len:278 (-) Transcript_12857:341-1174(-)
MEVVHPILLELCVHQPVAGLPALRHAQLFLHFSGVQEFGHMAKIIAKAAMLAWDAHVVRVHAGELVGHHLAVVADGVSASTRCAGARVALVNGGDARQRRGLHGPYGDAAVDDAPCKAAALRLTTVSRHVGVPLVLLGRVCEAVADAQALEVDGDALPAPGAQPDTMRDGWHIVPRVALAKDEEGVPCKLGQLLAGEQCLQKPVHVVAHLRLVVHGRQTSGKASACWLIHPHHVGLGVPTVGVLDGAGAVLVHAARPILGQESKLRGAARSTSEPHD